MAVRPTAASIAMQASPYPSNVCKKRSCSGSRASGAMHTSATPKPFGVLSNSRKWTLLAKRKTFGYGRRRWKNSVSVEFRQRRMMAGTRPLSTSSIALLIHRH